jgi:hypothetical protein
MDCNRSIFPKSAGNINACRADSDPLDEFVSGIRGLAWNGKSANYNNGTMDVE